MILTYELAMHTLCRNFHQMGGLLLVLIGISKFV